MASERNAKAISEDDVTSGLESLMASEVDLFENLFRSLPESQRLVARAIAKEPVAVFFGRLPLQAFVAFNFNRQYRSAEIGQQFAH